MVDDVAFCLEAPHIQFELHANGQVSANKFV